MVDDVVDEEPGEDEELVVRLHEDDVEEDGVLEDSNVA